MKTLISLALCLFVVTSSFAQEQFINYKAVIKDSNGNLIANQTIDVRFNIFEGAISLLEEVHTVTTDANGIVILNIGEGTVVNGAFSAINWSNTPHSLATEVDIEQNGTFIYLGNTAFKTVPYALHAANAGATSINGLSDGKAIDTSLFLGLSAGENDLSGIFGDFYVGFNVGIGFQALKNNIIGTGNTANGYKALFANEDGNSNTANGSESLTSNISGFRNTANGNGALFSNTTGNNNAATGSRALYANEDGNSNTANGVFALSNNTIGSGNVALGYQAGFNETGSNTLYIANSDTSTPLIYGEFDTKTLTINGTAKAKNPLSSGPDLVLGGNNASGDNGFIVSDPEFPSSDLVLVSNDAVTILLDDNNDELGQFEIRAGDGAEVFEVRESGNATLSGSLTQNSDRRLKKDIETLPYGLKEVLQLQPKIYNWKDRDQTPKSLGLIAQEVQPIIKEVVTAKDDDIKTLGISYTELIPVLINAIKEQAQKMDDLKTTLENLQTTQTKTIERLEKHFARLEN